MTSPKSIRRGFVVGAIIGACASLAVLAVMVLELQPKFDAKMIFFSAVEVVASSVLVGLIGAVIGAIASRHS